MMKEIVNLKHFIMYWTVFQTPNIVSFNSSNNSGRKITIVFPIYRKRKWGLQRWGHLPQSHSYLVAEYDVSAHTLGACTSKYCAVLFPLPMGQLFPKDKFLQEEKLAQRICTNIAHEDSGIKYHSALFSWGQGLHRKNNWEFLNIIKSETSSFIPKRAHKTIKSSKWKSGDNHSLLVSHEVKIQCSVSLKKLPNHFKMLMPPHKGMKNWM